MGLRPDEFWALTWEEYEYACRGYEQRQTREWERTRQLGEWMAAFNGVDLKKELRKQGRKRLLDLPGDKPADSVMAESPEQFMARMAANNFYRKPATA